MTVQNQHGDNTDEPDQPPGQLAAADLEVHNTVVAAAVSNVVQANTIGTIEFHDHPAPPGPPVPRQLPAAPHEFVGRDDQLTDLDRRTPDQEHGSEVVVISAIGGTGGIGKTWLALTWAHRNLHRFPDGQLSVDLRGFSPGDPRHPTDVLSDFLAALGVDRERQPADLDARAALYRTHTAGKRMLILLDNAATGEQVVPLLPGGATCTALITSRDRLRGLVARHSARPVRVDVLTGTEARTLLTTALGRTGEEGAITELVDLCGGFPLALGLIAARIRTHPDLLTDLVAELRDLGLGALDSEDPTASLPTVLSWSLHRLTDEQRTVFGLLGIAPGSDTTLPAVTALTALPPAHARKALSALEEASLIERRPHGRYAMHDLVRDYAATTDLPDEVRVAALVRVMDFHLHTAHTAHRLLNPRSPLVHPGSPTPDVHPHPLPDAAAATAWLDAEHATLLATQRAAVTLDRHHVVWHLAWALDTFHRLRGHRRDGLASWRAALDAAAHLSDPAARSRAHRNLGRACSTLDLHEETTVHLDRALELAVRHRDPTEQVQTHEAFAVAHGRRGDYRRASEHARHALDLLRTLDQPTWEGNVLNAAGWYAARLGDFTTAHDRCHAALVLHRHHHDFGGEARARGNLGYIAHHTGRHRLALDHFEQCLALLNQVGDTVHEAMAREWMGQAHAALDEHGQARAVWGQAAELYREQGRDADAERVRQQLHDLDNPVDTGLGST